MDEGRKIVEKSLTIVVKGTTIILLGTFFGMFLAFISKVMVVRYVTTTEYGLFSLGLVLINIFVVISSLGLQDGVTRQIAYYRGKKDIKKTHSIIVSSIQIAIVASLFCTLILFFTSDIISNNIFHSKDLSSVLKIFSISIPFLVMIGIFVSIFRGFDKVNAKVYFQDFLRNGLFLIFLVSVVFLTFSFLAVIYAYLASAVITCCIFVVYTIKRYPTPVQEKSTDIDIGRKELLFFSLPLLATTILYSIMTWTDTLMLGYFKNPEVVGLYNAVLPLVRLIPIFLVSMVFIYTPIATQLFSKNLIKEMRRNYAVLTKWVFSATLPLFLILFLFPDTVLELLYGNEYIGGSIALQILAASFFVHTFLGPNATTLLSIGKTKLLMRYSLVCAITNIILNVTLIPPMGIEGAAIASGVSLITINVLTSIHLFILTKIHPFTKNYLKPIVISFVIITCIYLIVKNLLVTIPFWLILILFALFLLVYGVCLLLTKSFDEEDIMILLTIEKRFGANLMPIKRILRRFM